MTTAFSSALKRGKAFLTPTNSSTSIPQLSEGFTKAPEGSLFPKVDPAIDGEDCDHDCESCSIKYPAKFKIDEDEKLYGYVNGWATHMLVATGKTDWVRDVSDEKGSVMEAVRDCGVEPSNGHINSAPTSTTPLPSANPSSESPQVQEVVSDSIPASQPNVPGQPPAPGISSPFTPRPCPHKYLILLCSQKTRDARCGQSAPLLRREFERHLRPLGLYRDLHDERPGGVGIYFISHVGGHKFSANLMIYRRASTTVNGDTSNHEGMGMGEGGQCIWLARVRPEHCEGIVKYTVLQGKVVKPERQLRGGFDRERKLVSW
ncbi:MAG: hypothetical protein Q9222_005058 [Ikaeria aurantiellina]